jgi:hypothetical protein
MNAIGGNLCFCVVLPLSFFLYFVIFSSFFHSTCALFVCLVFFFFQALHACVGNIYHMLIFLVTFRFCPYVFYNIHYCREFKTVGVFDPLYTFGLDKKMYQNMLMRDMYNVCAKQNII